MLKEPIDWFIFKKQKTPISLEKANHDLHCAHNFAFKVNKLTIKSKDVDKVSKKIEFVSNLYSILRDIGKNYGLTIPKFEMSLIHDKNGDYRLAYLEPDIGALFNDYRVEDIAREEFSEADKKRFIEDKKILVSIENLLNIVEEFQKIQES